MTTAPITLPDGLTAVQWAACLQQDLPDDAVPVLVTDDEWRFWADQLVMSPTFADAGSPGSAGFTNWLEWARAVIRGLNA